MKRRTCLVAALAAPFAARAHHGWSSFNTDQPVFIEGRVVSVKWQNPHAELIVELPADYKLPAGVATRAVPAQSASIDGKTLLAKAIAPTRKERKWEVELAPLTRLSAWKVEPIAVGTTVGVLGYTLQDPKGEAVVRAEYLYVGGQVYGLRSSPA
ncbi:DUF6152 family protein [Ramlibacter sp. PS3R-8]|uniref:DUF6152 family protein n=1 Tax=Ramlibacter sp. PS3R-8 TaxID=3133437 RepID=UPI0030B34C7E